MMKMNLPKMGKHANPKPRLRARHLSTIGKSAYAPGPGGAASMPAFAPGPSGGPAGAPAFPDPGAGGADSASLGGPSGGPPGM